MQAFFSFNQNKHNSTEMEKETIKNLTFLIVFQIDYKILKHYYLYKKEIQIYVIKKYIKIEEINQSAIDICLMKF